jgi:hypothetical protein
MPVEASGVKGLPMSTRYHWLTAASIVLLWAIPAGRASDAPRSAAPLLVVTKGSGGTCEVVGGSCEPCRTGSSGILHRRKAPNDVTLCPDACFGYFPTQWRKWEDACPIPFVPTGGPRVMPLIPTDSDKMPMKNSSIPGYRPFDPRNPMPAGLVLPAAYSGTRLK